MFEIVLWKQLALVASVIMPLFNIPLILRMLKRKSSQDISLIWLLGVFGCIVLMFPYGIQAEDIVLKAFSIANLLLFAIVVFVALYLRLLRKDFDAKKTG